MMDGPVEANEHEADDEADKFWDEMAEFFEDGFIRNWTLMEFWYFDFYNE